MIPGDPEPGAESPEERLTPIPRLRELLQDAPWEEQLNILRREITAGQNASRRLLSRLETASSDQLLDNAEEAWTVFGDEEMLQAAREFRAQLAALQAESEALQAIRQAAGSDHAVAAQRYRDYLREHPVSFLACSYLGCALQELREWDAAVSAYRDAYRLSDSAMDRAFSRCMVGRALHLKGDLPAAIREFHAVIDGEAGEAVHALPGAYFWLGEALRDSGDLAGARAAWGEVLRLDQTGILAAEAQSQLRGAAESGDSV